MLYRFLVLIERILQIRRVFKLYMKGSEKTSEDSLLEHADDILLPEFDKKYSTQLVFIKIEGKLFAKQLMKEVDFKKTFRILVLKFDSYLKMCL